MSYETKTLPSGIVIENKLNSYQTYCWFIKGTTILHNEGEPAVEDEAGNKFWCLNGRHHRLDGPAMECIDGRKYYHIDGKEYFEEVYWKHPDVIAFKYLKEHPELQAFT